MNILKQITVLATAASLLTLISCNKEDLHGLDEFAIAGFSLTPATTYAGSGFTNSIPDGEIITLYYGDPLRQNFQEGRISGDSILFNYPVLLRKDNPGRLQARYVKSGSITTGSNAITLADTLYIDSEDPSTLTVSYLNYCYTIGFSFKHTNALVDFSVKGNEIDLTEKIDRVDITIDKGNGLEETYTSKGPQIIVPAGEKPKLATITFKDGKKMPLISNFDVTFERNKRYPVSIDIELNSAQPVIRAKGAVENWDSLQNDKNSSFATYK